MQYDMTPYRKGAFFVDEYRNYGGGSHGPNCQRSLYALKPQ